MKSGQDKADLVKTRDIDVALGQRLREIRDAMGLSRREVAEALAVSVSRIKNYEEGTRISASRLWQFCGRYGVSVEGLFEGLPHHIGARAVEIADENAAFVNPLAEDIVRAIAEAAADLSPVERRLALASLRGMGVRNFKVP